ncbi:GNAT family N-acetyltransferase [Novosphingobium sp. PASSN1]|uniref:GNAT family N-acetyltransferase n=1 Tax=Novosphingobium sp. PASSN1 TaxID=2015561 RepID=UPI000BC4DB4C|nr:GNAT family N-acetyltransferase [Novosphingobium sp. PASSN1]OYU36689.1 MAG: GNAT family N-acetyltransferase [Novosphingobium sp. PASSN1]
MTDGVTAELLSKVSEIPADQWDALNPRGNPFVAHAFLAALEESGSVASGTGWSPAPIMIRDADGIPAAALPAYLKSHSQGEYVFDHHWADAFERAGGQYYPKLQIAAPFSPVPGPRLLLRDPALAPAILAAAEAVVDQNGLSSAHATFVEEGELDAFRAAGWLTRMGTQFHWQNRDYADFDDFLSALSSRKRKAIRKERAAAQSAVRIAQIRGADITPDHWDAFWVFYQDTGARKWGQPYLTRAFFDLIGESMQDSIVLFLAYDGDRPIAGALNLVSPDCLYGRYWGCTREVPFLHFELCYYQAIDYAIAHGLPRVEAGAQGEHKLARGYEAVPTYSAHYIANAGFRSAVADFLARESQAMERQIEFLGEMAPFKKG